MRKKIFLGHKWGSRPLWLNEVPEKEIKEHSKASAECRKVNSHIRKGEKVSRENWVEEKWRGINGRMAWGDNRKTFHCSRPSPSKVSRKYQSSKTTMVTEDKSVLRPLQLPEHHPRRRLRPITAQTFQFYGKRSNGPYTATREGKLKGLPGGVPHVRRLWSHAVLKKIWKIKKYYE